MLSIEAKTMPMVKKMKRLTMLVPSWKQASNQTNFNLSQSSFVISRAKTSQIELKSLVKHDLFFQTSSTQLSTNYRSLFNKHIKLKKVTKSVSQTRNIDSFFEVAPNSHHKEPDYVSWRFMKPKSIDLRTHFKNTASDFNFDSVCCIGKTNIPLKHKKDKSSI